MITPVSGKRPKYKRFNYQPRFYDPDAEEQTKRTEHDIKFQRVVPRRGGNGLFIYILILFMLIYFYL